MKAKVKRQFKTKTQVRARNKGKAFEALVVKFLRLKFGWTKIQCYRTPCSGGHRFASKTDPGDVFIAAECRDQFPYHIECKNTRHGMKAIHRFMQPEKSRLRSTEHKWLAQACKGATDDGRRPLLVFRAGSVLYCAKKAGVTRTGMPGMNFEGVMINEKSQKFSIILFKYEGLQWEILRFVDLLKRTGGGNALSIKRVSVRSKSRTA